MPSMIREKCMTEVRFLTTPIREPRSLLRQLLAEIKAFDRSRRARKANDFRTYFGSCLTQLIISLIVKRRNDSRDKRNDGKVFLCYINTRLWGSSTEVCVNDDENSSCIDNALLFGDICFELRQHRWSSWWIVSWWVIVEDLYDQRSICVLSLKKPERTLAMVTTDVSQPQDPSVRLLSSLCSFVNKLV